MDRLAKFVSDAFKEEEAVTLRADAARCAEQAAVIILTMFAVARALYRHSLDVDARKRALETKREILKEYEEMLDQLFASTNEAR